MKIVTWDLQWAKPGTERHQRAISHLESLDADVIVTTEHNDERPSTPNTACVDFSAVRGGDLVAYRWDGEPTLQAANFVHS